MTPVARIAMLALALAGSAFAEVRAVDDSGTVVTLPAPARRIVSLAPHATELLFAAGAGDRIVGVIEGSDHPEAARALPRVGDSSAIEVERILVLAPDLVVAWPWSVPRQVAQLRALGVVVFVSNPATPEGIAGDLEGLGRLAGTDATARRSAQAFRAKLSALRRQASGPPVRVFYQVSDAPLFTLGGRHLVSQAIELCGGANVFADLGIPAPQVGIEAVLEARPEAIVAGTAGAARPAWLDDWARWPKLHAVTHDNLFVVDADLLHRAGPRFAEGVAQLCAALAVADARLRSRRAGTRE